MNFRGITVYLLVQLVLLSCGGEGSITDQISGTTTHALEVNLSSITIHENQLVLSGLGLDNVTSIQITGPNSFNETFNIESQSNTSLIANGAQLISFNIGSMFDLILSSAHSAASFSVTFTLNDGEVTGTKINQMGASDGDALVWDNINST